MPASPGPFDDRGGQATQTGEHQQLSYGVERACPCGFRFRHEAGGQCDRSHTDRQVDPEDRAPADCFCEGAPNQGTYAQRYAGDRTPHADRASADKLASRLRANGYDTFVKADGEAGGKRFRVRVGPVSARARAEELAAKLAKVEKLPTWILDESKG